MPDPELPVPVDIPWQLIANAIDHADDEAAGPHALPIAIDFWHTTTASGNVAPIRRIAGPNTGFGTGLISNAAVFVSESANSKK